MLPDPLAARVVAALVAAEQTLVVAESLTGGLIGATITSVPGASRVFLGGVISYATATKGELAGVPPSILAEYGPVSHQTATAMAAGVAEITGADWGLAATGVAGPDPQDGHRPGEVWIGLAGPGRPASARRLELAGSREQIRLRTVGAALGWLADCVDPSTRA